REAAQAAEARGWNLSIEEMTVKTKALKDAGITVLAPTQELKSGMAKIGDTIAKEWAASAGTDGEAMLAAYRKESRLYSNLSRMTLTRFRVVFGALNILWILPVHFF